MGEGGIGERGMVGDDEDRNECSQIVEPIGPSGAGRRDPGVRVDGGTMAGGVLAVTHVRRYKMLSLGCNKQTRVSTLVESAFGEETHLCPCGSEIRAAFSAAKCCV